MGAKGSKKRQNEDPEKKIPILPTHKTITEYPQGYQAWSEPYSDKSPYKNTDFDTRVASAISQDTIDPDRLKSCKIVLVGDQGAGKTNLVKRFCKDIFEVTQPYQATIAMDFEVEQFVILSIPYHVQVWDTAGEKRWKSIAAGYCKDADVVMVVFDFSQMRSFEMVEEWKDGVDKYVKNPFFFLVGTQKDLMSEGGFESMDELAVQLAQRLGMEYWAVSAKTGERVKDLFARATVLSFEKHAIKYLDTLEKFVPKEKNEKECCRRCCPCCFRSPDPADVTEMYTRAPTTNPDGQSQNVNGQRPGPSTSNMEAQEETVGRQGSTTNVDVEAETIGSQHSSGSAINIEVREENVGSQQTRATASSTEVQA